ncbi:hypothetical protein [Spirosoma endbachense]|uniref:Uncharacterized protein n=1 Tax=Spirosoma endbachense TaxID=2666025 RepID=A0A6P1W6S7_9BACT|nr:hypothetical protein [Spirosoma endbachense]QHV99416.1 hypothetical protein GJR95_32340 [Spirosoma endbachense]
MHSISLRFTQELTQRLNQMSIRSTRYKVALHKPLNQDQPQGHKLTEIQSENTVFAFNIMFERNNPESGWRFVTPLKFTD